MKKVPRLLVRRCTCWNLIRAAPRRLISVDTTRPPANPFLFRHTRFSGKESADSDYNVYDTANKLDSEISALQTANEVQTFAKEYMNFIYDKFESETRVRDTQLEDQQKYHSFGKYGFYKSYIPYADVTSLESPLTISYHSTIPPDKYSELQQFLTQHVRIYGMDRVASLISLLGTGKTFSMYHLARQGNFVIPVAISLEPFEKIIKEFANESSVDLAFKLETEFRRLLQWYVFCVTTLTKSREITPTQLLRFMVNGGGQAAITQFVHALQTKPNLESPKVNEPGLLVFDDTEKDLMKAARDLRLKRKSYEDFDSGSLFDIAYRAARSIAPSLFMGTSYEMQYMDSHDEDEKNILTVSFARVLPVYAHNVVPFLQDLINVEAHELLFLRFFLQGRPKHMDFFINCLHKVCLENPCTKEEFEKKSTEQKILFRREILNEALLRANQDLTTYYKSLVQSLLPNAAKVPLRISLFGKIEANKCDRKEMVALSEYGVAHFSLSHTVARIQEPQFMKCFIDEYLHHGPERETAFLKALQANASTHPHHVSKVFIAYLLMDISRTHWNQPITNHPLFHAFKNTYLDDYKLAVRYYHYDQNADSFIRDLHGTDIQETYKNVQDILDNKGLAPSMVHALTKDITVSESETDVVERFELPSIILFLPEYERPTFMAMLVPVSGRGKAIPLTCAVTDSIFEFKDDYVHTDLSLFMSKTRNQEIADDLSKIDPNKALRIMVTPKLKLFNTSLQELVEQKNDGKFSMMNDKNHCVTHWSVQNPQFMDYLQQHSRSTNLVKMFNLCAEAFELYI